LGGIVTALLEAEKVYLSSSSTAEEKQMAVKFIVHFVGDAHQPLHTGRPEDNGGNKIQVPWHGQKVTLHSVWDSFMLGEGHPDFMSAESQNNGEVPYAKYLIDKYKNMTVDQNAIGDLSAWIDESMNLRPDAYKYVDENEAQYTARFIDSVDQRLYLAGVRMADFLNQMILKEQQPTVRISLRAAIEKISGSLSDFISMKPRPHIPVDPHDDDDNPGKDGVSWIFIR
jgi:hypothetical protein